MKEKEVLTLTEEAELIQFFSKALEPEVFEEPIDLEEELADYKFHSNREG